MLLSFVNKEERPLFFTFVCIFKWGMIIFLQKLLICWVLMMVVLPTHAQPNFSAVLSPAEISKDEYTTLRLLIENASDIARLSQPNLKDFVIVSGPNQESGMNNVNGSVTHYLAISYILQPRRSGNFVLPALKATLDGKNYSSAPLKLKVKNGNGGGSSLPAPYASLSPFAQPERQPDFTDFILKPNERVPDKVNKNMVLKLETSKASCYVGEPIVASYKLYSRLRSESRLTKNPAFNGFSVIDLQQPDVTGYAREKLNGRDYNVYTIRKAQLYPLQDGTIELETATLENNVLFLKSDASEVSGNIDGFVNGMGLSTSATVSQVVSLNSQPVTIQVKPLPVAGKPVSFNGAVGKFDISASLEKNSLTTTETGRLRIVVSGQGNLQLVTAPEVNWPKELEIFDVNVVDELEQTTVPVSGRKIFEIPFTVSKEGNYTLPAVSFSYFDPVSGSYKTSASEPIFVTVVKGTDKPAVYVDASAQEQSFSLATTLFKNRMWVVGAIALLIAMGVFFWMTQESKKQPASSAVAGLPATLAKENLFVEETLSLISKNPLALAENCLQTEECVDFYSLLNHDIKHYLADKFKLDLQELNAKKISSVMDKAGIDNELALQTQELLQDIEWQLYTPFERNDEMEKFYNRSQDLVKSIQTCHLHVSR